VSQACKTILDKLGGYTLVERGIVSIKVLIRRIANNIIINFNHYRERGK
jgi:hypothetical protein